MTLEELLASGKLCAARRNGKGYICLCPCHDDHHPSLHVWEADGAVRVECFAGCDWHEVRRALGLDDDRRDPLADHPAAYKGSPIISKYRYRDRDGRLLYTVGRTAAKEFPVWRPDPSQPGGIEWGWGEVEHIPYRLAEVLAAAAAGEPVFVVEGEKDAETGRRLGIVATTTPGGAKAPWLAGHSESLRGADVIIIPDNDVPGRAHAAKVAKALQGIARSVTMVELPGLPEKGDLSDWVAAGGDLEQLVRLVAAAQHRQDNDARSDHSSWTAPRTSCEDHGQRQNAHGKRISPVLVRASEIEPTEVGWLWPGRVPAGKLTVLAGDPGLAKSFITTDMAARVSTGAAWPDGGQAPLGNTIFLTAEDGLADTLVPRLIRLGGDRSRITALTAVSVETTDGDDVVRKERFFSLSDDLDALEDAVQQEQALLAVIDPITAYFGRGDSYKDAEVRQVLAPVAQLAERTGVAIVVVMHFNKNSAAQNAIYRVANSLAFTAAARSVLGVAPDPEHDGRNLLLSVKINVAAKPAGLGYRVVDLDGPDSGVVRWDDEPVTVDAATVFGPARPDSPEMSEAKEFLRVVLGSGERVAQRDVVDEAAERGIKEHTLRRAAKSLGVKFERQGFGRGGVWYWSLTKGGAA